MTCIVGLECNGIVYIGGDSVGVAGYDAIMRADEKVFVNDGFIMGFTTSYRMGQLLKYAFVPPDHSSKKDDMMYLVTDFVDGIRLCFREKGYLSKSGEREEGGCFLLGYRGKLYKVDSDFQIAKSMVGFNACGAGAQQALGSMFSTQNWENPTARIEMALKSAAEFNACVRPPFVIINSNSMDLP